LATFTCNLSGDIYSADVANLTGTQFRVRQSTGFFLPAWSPDGERLVFISNVWGRADLRAIYVSNSDGTAITRLTLDSHEDWGPWCGDVKVGVKEVEVSIGIKLGGDLNSINVESRPVIPVAVLTTEDFDDSSVDVGGVRFGPGKAEAFHDLQGHAGEDLKRTEGTLTKKLSKWLCEKGYILEELARKGTEEGAEATCDLPRGERYAEILLRGADALAIDAAELDDKYYQDFEHYTIAKVIPGKLWLEVFEEGGEKTLGPIPLPKRATGRLRKGWEISCALGRIRGKWRIVEAENVYSL